MSVSLEEILTYLMLIIVGYFVAKMFSKTCNGFSVGGRECNNSGFHDITQMKHCYYNDDTRCYALEGGVGPNSCERAVDQSIRYCNDVSGGATEHTDSTWMWEELSESEQIELCEGYTHSSGAKNGCNVVDGGNNSKYCTAKNQECKTGYTYDENKCKKDNIFV